MLMNLDYNHGPLTFQIKLMRTYPQNGNHLELVFLQEDFYFPFEIVKGLDNDSCVVNEKLEQCKKFRTCKKEKYQCKSFKNKWVVYINLKESDNKLLLDLFKKQQFENHIAALDYCLKVYRKYCEVKIKQLNEYQERIKNKINSDYGK